MICTHRGAEALEVGAEIGSTTQVVCLRRQDRWVCLGPALNVIDVLKKAEPNLPPDCEIWQGIIGRVARGRVALVRFSTMIY